MILDELHDNHPGITYMKSLASSNVWWPSMDTLIEQKVKSWNSCQLYESMLYKVPILPWENPEAPWVRLHLDYAGPFMQRCEPFIKTVWVKCQLTFWNYVLECACYLFYLNDLNSYHKKSLFFCWGQYYRISKNSNFYVFTWAVI